MKIEELNAYEVLEKREIADINSISYLLKHKKTGARVALLSNDDENKVFYIGFRTPPKDSTGVAHILEHSVLCGSKEFPLKDPFVELVKGSLNTFLNAITYSDKTLYPVASCNDKDFQNLMHVYLDAVFYPNIYTNKSIFLQEGWHYEITDPSEELKVNGVVYNEMKGAFSSPDDVLDRETINSLYPDTAYGVESGGDPKDIPNLTYENFLEFHKEFYHPSNSYIYLYGDMDMVEKLKFIDEEYLSRFDDHKVDSEIAVQKPFTSLRRIVKDYPIAEGEDEEENTFLSLNYALGDSLDKELYVAFDVLDYAICSAPGAPLKKALVDRNVGKDVYSEYENGIKQPFFSIVAKDTSVDKEELFLSTVEEVLSALCKEGIEEKALLAAINHFEFKYREADFGAYPKGLMYGIQMLDSWLYDDTKPFIHIEANETFGNLRKRIKEGYFEELIRKYFLENTHKSLVILRPRVGLLEEEEKQWKEQLAKKKASMSEAELRKCIDEFAEMTKFQETPDAKEKLEKIPLLNREDLKKEAPEFILEEKNIEDTLFLYHELFTNEIAYVRLLFDLKNIPGEYYPYIGILKNCLALMDTEKYEYGQLFHELNLITGGMAVVSNTYTDYKDSDKIKLTMEVKAKMLKNRLPEAMELLEEIILNTNFSDTKRIYEILSETKSRMQSHMMSAGHSVAAMRALSYGSMSTAINEEIAGIPFYRFITHILDEYEQVKEEVSQKLSELSKMIFRKENLMVDLIGDKEMADLLSETVIDLKKRLCTEPVKKECFVPELSVKNEGFMNSAQVLYVARAGNFRKKGLEYTGCLKVLKVILGYEYLWVNVRVKGGAYGCSCAFGLSGDSYFASYRDPNLEKTIEIYEKAAEAVAAFEADERTMTQYVIGAVSNLDTPMNPSAKGLSAMSAYLSGISWEAVQQWRDEMLHTDVEDIRGLSAYIKAFMSDEQLCVVGNAGKIKEQEKLFGKTENLL